MKVTQETFTIIIPHNAKNSDDKDRKNYYSKAVAVEEDMFDRIDQAMQEELLFGEVEYC